MKSVHLINVLIFVISCLNVAFAKLSSYGLGERCEIARRYATEPCSGVYLICKPGYYLAFQNCPTNQIFDPEMQRCVYSNKRCSQNKGNIAFGKAELEVGVARVKDTVKQQTSASVLKSQSGSVSSSRFSNGKKQSSAVAVDEIVNEKSAGDWPTVGGNNAAVAGPSLAVNTPMVVSEDESWPVIGVDEFSGLAYSSPYSLSVVSGPIARPFRQGFRDRFIVPLRPRRLRFMTFMPRRTNVFDQFRTA
uniref:Chitin-binding type-2 domain-containing protein n=1 Tax=Syphacia muris TaxID=451379 RepID=A0A0N5A922_9BILA